MTTTAVQGRVETTEILVVADRDARGLHKDQPKERVTLLRDLAEMVRIRGPVETALRQTRQKACS